MLPLRYTLEYHWGTVSWTRKTATSFLVDQFPRQRNSHPRIEYLVQPKTIQKQKWIRQGDFEFLLYCLSVTCSFTNIGNIIQTVKGGMLAFSWTIKNTTEPVFPWSTRITCVWHRWHLLPLISHQLHGFRCLSLAAYSPALETGLVHVFPRLKPFPPRFWLEWSDNFLVACFLNTQLNLSPWEALQRTAHPWMTRCSSHCWVVAP